MMRENMGLYRGKRRDTGEWVEGYLAGYDLICTEEPQDVRHATGEYYDQIAYVGFVEVDPATVGQFTGLLDKNGKRIFDGDVVTVDGEVGCFELQFNENTATFVMDGDAIRASFNIFESCEVEVIGNIHDRESGGERK